MNVLFVALGLVLVIEGMTYALAPSAMQSAMRQLAELKPDSLRMGGLAAMVMGVFIVWFCH